jgi:hypothetical protein
VRCSDIDRQIVTLGSAFSTIFVAIFFYFAVLVFAGECCFPLRFIRWGFRFVDMPSSGC